VSWSGVDFVKFKLERRLLRLEPLKVTVTKHAKKRMHQYQVSEEDIVNALKNGKASRQTDGTILVRRGAIGMPLKIVESSHYRIITVLDLSKIFGVARLRVPIPNPFRYRDIILIWR